MNTQFLSSCAGASSLRSRRTRRFVLLAALAPFTVLAGCGGGGNDGNDNGGSTGRGTVVVRFAWPDRTNPTAGTHPLPLGANSVRLSVRGAASPSVEIAGRVVARPEASATFTEVPTGRLIIQASAFATGDASGVAQARADLTVDAADDQTTSVDAVLTSTINRVDFQPEQITPGGATTVAATAYDAQNNVVPTDRFTWTVSDGTVFQIQGAGTTAANVTSVVVNNVGAGTSLLTLTETESGASIARSYTIVQQQQGEVTGTTGTTGGTSGSGGGRP